MSRIARALLSVCLPAFSCIAMAGPAEPQPGMWWSPQESGRGYALDPQGEQMVVTSFAYDDSGSMQWYYSPGNLTNGGSHWCGPLLKFNFGQPLDGGYVAPTNVGNDGTICIDLSSRVSGTLTLPSGRQVAIQRQNFGVGNPPQALLGTWGYIESIGGANFVDIYSFTTIAGATSTGTGVVVDTVNRAGFEYETSGPFAGRVVGFHYSSSGTVLDQYLYQLQMEEGRGFWVSPLTFNQYGMSAYKITTAGGFSKAAAPSTAVARDLAMKGVVSTPKGVTIGELESTDPERGRLAEEIWARLAAH